MTVCCWSAGPQDRLTGREMDRCGPEGVNLLKVFESSCLSRCTALCTDIITMRLFPRQVLMGVRATDAITNTDRLKDRKLTFWHGVKVKKASKDRITYAENDVLRKKCRAGITIVEQQAREAVEREQAAADPDSLVLPTESKASSPENVRLVFSLFHSVPEVVGLDSIYKTQLFHELRIERYAAGSVVFRQWEQQAAVSWCVYEKTGA